MMCITGKPGIEFIDIFMLSCMTTGLVCYLILVTGAISFWFDALSDLTKENIRKEKWIRTKKNF